MFCFVQDKLANISVSVSTDSPEGGLDALLQVAVCPEVSLIYIATVIY